MFTTRNRQLNFDGTWKESYNCWWVATSLEGRFAKEMFENKHTHTGQYMIGDPFWSSFVWKQSPFSFKWMLMTKAGEFRHVTWQREQIYHLSAVFLIVSNPYRRAGWLFELSVSLKIKIKSSTLSNFKVATFRKRCLKFQRQPLRSRFVSRQVNSTYTE